MPKLRYAASAVREEKLMERDTENNPEWVAADGRLQASLKRPRNEERGKDLRSELDKIIKEVSGKRIDALIALTNANGLRRVFSDGELMRTALSFINNSLNISEAARALYMHRNTMMYRLEKIKRVTGLNIKRFDDAMAFKILYKAFRRREEE